jgi:deoxycytidylate deaminase
MFRSSALELIADPVFRNALLYFSAKGQTELNIDKSIDLSWLLSAREASQASEDPSLRVGAVIVKEGEELGRGYNHFPNEQQYHRDQRELMFSNKNFKYEHIIHAEVDALKNALRKGAETLDGSTIYLYPCQPCLKCAEYIVQYGIKKIVAPVHIDCDASCSTCKGDNFSRYAESFAQTASCYKEFGVELVLIPIKQIQSLFPPLPVMQSDYASVGSGPSDSQIDDEEGFDEELLRRKISNQRRSNARW